MAKNSATNYLTLGIFTLLGLALLTFGLYFIGRQQNLFGTTFTIHGVFKDVAGLQSGSNVRFSGINVGTVEAITITSDTTVKVSMILESDVRKFIKKDASAIIGNEGLMGNKVVNINAGSPEAPLLEHNGEIATLQPMDFDEILGEVKESVSNVKRISASMATMLEDIQGGKGLAGKVLFDKNFANKMDRTVTNIESSTRNVYDLLEATKKTWVFRKYFDKRTPEEKAEDERIEKEERNKLKEIEKAEKADAKAKRKAERQAKRDARKAAREAKKAERNAEKVAEEKEENK